MGPADRKVLDDPRRGGVREDRVAGLRSSNVTGARRHISIMDLTTPRSRGRSTNEGSQFATIGG